MSKLLKFLGIFIGAIIALVLVAIIVLVTFVSPNRFKPLISDQAKKYTGRQLTIDGDLSWTFFPTLGVKAGHMLMDNPEGFKEKTFAEISSVTVGVKLLPLLHGNVESSGIALHGMKLNLIKNAEGKTNWTFPASAPTAPTKTEVSLNGDTKTTTSYGLAVSSVDVTDTTVNWIDEQSKQTAAINNFEFHAKNINLTQSFPIETQFDFDAKTQNATGHAKLTSDIAFNLQKQVYSLRNVDFTADVHQAAKKMNLHVTGDVIADLVQQTLDWTNFKASLENLNVVGRVNVVHLTSAPEATGHFNLQPFDLKELLKNLGQDTSNIQTAKNVDGNLDFSASAKTINAKGKIQIDTLQAAKIKLTHINLSMRYQDGILDLVPVTANLYQGNLEAQAQVKLNTPEPQMMLQAQLKNVQAEPLLTDLKGPNQKIKIIGAGNVELQVTTSGKSGDAIVKNLNGTSHISFNNGVIQGVDIGYLVDTAYALASRQSPSAGNTGKTSFGNLTASAVIHNGVISNEDLLLDAPRFITKGNGTIDLVNQHIDYSLQATVKEQQNAVKHFSGITIPIRITGNLDNPTVRLDTEAFLKSVAQQQFQQRKEQIQQKIQEKIQDKLGGQLPGKAGDVLKSLLGN